MIALALTALQGLPSSTYEPYTFISIAGKAGVTGVTHQKDLVTKPHPLHTFRCEPKPPLDVGRCCHLGRGRGGGFRRLS